MPLSTRDYAQLTDELQSIFNESSANAIADAVGLSKVFSVMDTNLLNYEHQILHGVKGVEEIAEGSDFPRVLSEEGDNITYTQRHFGVNVPITKKMRKFDLFNQMESIVRSVTDDAWNKVDQSLADVLLNGWSTSYTDVYGATVAATGPDAVALFSATHSNDTSGTTYSNIINDGTNSNPTLSRAAIIAAIKNGLVYKDPNGIIRPIRFDTLLVPPSLADLAYRIVDNDRLYNSTDWDVNKYLRGRIKEIVVWERLEQSGGGTSTSAYWFLYDSRKIGETLKCLFSERPSLDAPQQVYENKDWEYTIDYFYVHGLGFEPYIQGSQGTNT